MQKSKERQQMFSLIERWKSSGQSQRAYCRQHHIAYHVFHYWYKRYREQQEKDAETPSSFVAVQLQAESSTIAPYAELILPNGKRLLFHQRVEAATLNVLLQ